MTFLLARENRTLSITKNKNILVDKWAEVGSVCVSASGYIHALGISLPYRNKGYGGLLLEAAIDVAELMGAIPTLDCNHTKLSFYLKRGFLIFTMRGHNVDYDRYKLVYSPLISIKMTGQSQQNQSDTT